MCVSVFKNVITDNILSRALRVSLSRLLHEEEEHVLFSGSRRSSLFWEIVSFLLHEYIRFSAASLSLSRQGFVHC